MLDRTRYPCEEKANIRYRNDSEYRDRILAARRAHYALNREAKIASVKKWRSENQDRCAEHYATQRRDIAKGLYRGAKYRAKVRNIQFEISVEDVVVPTHCPVLGVALKYGTGHLCPESPTLDRIIPSLGYVKGNIAVISMRANMIKNDASVEDLEKVLSWLRSFFLTSPTTPTVPPNTPAPATGGSKN